MVSSSSDNTIATYTNIPNKILMTLFALELSRPEWKLYLYLRYRKNNNSGKAWPGMNTTVREAHISRKDIKPARDRLIELGLITAIPRPGDTTLIDFNDECCPQGGGPTVGTGGSAHRGHRGSAHRGHSTITSTSTNKTTTKKGTKKKGTKKKSTRGTVRLSPDAPPKRKEGVPTGGTTPKSVRPTVVKPLSADEVRKRQEEWNKKQRK